MRLIDSSGSQRTLCATVGAMTGYLLWVAYYDLQLVPSFVVIALIHSMKGLTPWLGVEITRMLALVLTVVTQALPGAILLGTIVGLVLPRFSAKRWLCYSVLAWPVIAFAASYFLLAQIDSSAGPQIVEPLWQTRSEHALVGLAIYSLFFVVMFLSYTFVSLNKPHNPLLNSDARDESARAS